MAKDNGSPSRRFPLHCWLCWKITAAVFAAILTIEALILLPSYRNYERDRVLEHGRIAEAAVAGALSLVPEDASAETLTSLLTMALGAGNVAGLVLLDRTGVVLVSVGTPLSPAVLNGSAADRVHRQIDRQRLEARWPLARGPVAAAAASIATPHLSDDLVAFVFRILGLIALIAVVVTGATMLALQRLVLGRIVDLDKALIAASSDPEKAALPPPSRGRSDELDSVFASFRTMRQRISDALAARRHSETELKRLNQSLESEVRRRTADLRAAKDRAERASQAKSDFLANMSHELRTPLNAINGFSEMMEHEILGPLGNAHYRAYAADIRRSGSHLLAIIDDVLDMARIEAGRVVPDTSLLDLATVLDEAAEMAQPLADNAQLTFCRTLSPALPAVYGDARMIRQIVFNLLTNAIKFTPPQGRVELSAEMAADGGLVIQVTDTGIGVAPDDRERIMQPFEQVSSPFSRNHQGTGLGLPLALRFVALHDGRLELDSAVGVGTRVTVTLPSQRLVVPLRDRQDRS